MIRREGDPVPRGISFQWWRGPAVWVRVGEWRRRLGLHLYRLGDASHLGFYVD